MNQDLKSRIPVAIAYVLIIAALTMSGQVGTVVLVFVFFAFCLYEFVSGSLGGSSGSSVYIYGLSLVIMSLIFVPGIKDQWLEILVSMSCTLLILNVLFLMIKKQSLTSFSPLMLIALLYVVLPYFIAMAMTVNYAVFPKVMLGTFVIVWLNDAGAYFSGRAFGRTKLFESISPNKTWEGLIGGGIAGVVITWAIYPVISGMSQQSWLILSIIIWITGSWGDLVESSWKRQQGLKDSGKLMGGHGGFLDRLDSFIYAIPFVSAYFLLTQLK